METIEHIPPIDGGTIRDVYADYWLVRTEYVEAEPAYGGWKSYRTLKSKDCGCEIILQDSGKQSVPNVTHHTCHWCMEVIPITELLPPGATNIIARDDPDWGICGAMFDYDGGSWAVLFPRRFDVDSMGYDTIPADATGIAVGIRWEWVYPEWNVPEEYYR
jgi:hypothetical protein